VSAPKCIAKLSRVDAWTIVRGERTQSFG